MGHRSPPRHGKRRRALTLPRLLALGAAAAGSALAPPAGAYCRSTTCDALTEPGGCEPDELGCATLGTPLYWAEPCVTYAVQEDGSPRQGVTAFEADRAMQAGFEAWLASECGGGQGPSIGVVPLGGARCDQVEFNPPDNGRGGAPNANLVIFRDDAWRHADEGSVIARTCLTFNTDTGEILDADIEINSLEVDLSTSDTEITNDLQAILTHEIGHFLGLDHSSVPGATMQRNYARADLGTRTLSSDDQAGMCSIYAPDDDVPAECPPDTAPRHGYSRDCGSEARAEGGCLSIGGPVPSSKDAWLGCGVLALLWGLGTRRRSCRC